MYDYFKRKILHEGKLTDYTDITNGVKQGCILSPIIFLLVLDNMMRKTLGNRKREIQWGMKIGWKTSILPITYVYCHRDTVI
jgi:hypothetical protein